MKMRNILIAFLACLFIAGCGDKGYDVSIKPTFEVLSVEVEYGASGGTGTIMLDLNDGGSVSAVSEKDWCRIAVSGNTISVTVDAHGSLQSRESIITISKDGYTREIGIFQNGRLLYPTEEYGELGDKIGAELTIPFYRDGISAVTVYDHSNWIDAVFNDNDELIITATEAALWSGSRDGFVTLSVNGKTKVITFTQRKRAMDYDGFLGDYTMTSYNVLTDPLNSYDISIEVGESGKTYILKGLTYDIEMSYLDGEMRFYAGQKVGTYTTGGNTFDVFTRVINDESSTSSTSSYYIYSTYEIVDDVLIITLNCSREGYTGFALYYTSATGSLTRRGDRYRSEITLYPK